MRAWGGRPNPLATGRRPVLVGVLVATRAGIRLCNAEYPRRSWCVLVTPWWSNRTAIFGSAMRFAGCSWCGPGGVGVWWRGRPPGSAAAANVLILRNPDSFLVNPGAHRPLDMYLPPGHSPPSVRGRVLRSLSSRCGVLWGSQLHHWQPGTNPTNSQQAAASDPERGRRPEGREAAPATLSGPALAAGDPLELPHSRCRG